MNVTYAKSKWHLRSFRVTHYVILNIVLYEFYELNMENKKLININLLAFNSQNVYKMTFKMT